MKTKYLFGALMAVMATSCTAKTRLHATAYDLQGRPVSSGHKGIIIQNGQKQLIQ